MMNTMKTIKLMHMADVHLDSPFSMRSPSQAERCRTELRGAFTSAVLLAKSNGIDLVLISGDLFDGEYVTPDTRDLLISTFASAPECRFFICPGNHDPLTAGSVYKTADFPDNVFIFGKDGEVCELPELGVNIYGRAFEARSMISSPLAGFDRLPGDRINILVCHGDVDAPLSEYGPINKKEIAASGFDYIALGHIHKNSGLQKEGDTYWSYPGCLMGRGFDETGEKGVMIGLLEKGDADIRFYPVARRVFAERTVELTSSMSKTEALEHIRSELRTLRPETELRLTLVGEVGDGVMINASEIGEGCTLTDKTVPRTDYTALELSGTIKGVFYARMKERLDACEIGSEQYSIVLEAMKLGLAALADRTVEIPSGGDRQ